MITTVVAVLAAALILPQFNPAHAANVATVEDGKKQLSPKSFGEKSKTTNCDYGRCFSLDINHKGKYSDMKIEQIKSYKKIDEQLKAINIMQSYYRLG